MPPGGALDMMPPCHYNFPLGKSFGMRPRAIRFAVPFEGPAPRGDMTPQRNARFSRPETTYPIG